MPNIEQEIKVSLCDPSAYPQVQMELDREGSYVGTVTLTSTYFDTEAHESTQQKACMRLRELKTTKDTTYTATLKAKPSITAMGVFKAIEEEVGIAREDYEMMMNDTTGDKILAFFKENVCDLHTVLDNTIEGKLFKLASFTTIRRKYKYRKHTIELDNVMFILPRPGRLVEIECETDDPQKALEDVRAFLGRINVMFTHSTTTKLGKAMSLLSASGTGTPNSTGTPRLGIATPSFSTGSFVGTRSSRIS